MQPEFEIWLDNQSPAHSAKWIQDTFNFTARSAYILQIKTASDWQIYNTAKESKKPVIIISKHGDFSKIIAQSGTLPKLIKLNTGNMPSRVLWDLLRPNLPQAIQLLTSTETEIIYLEQTDN